MIRRRATAAAMALLVSPALADEFAVGWPLVLSEPAAGAHRVELDLDVYRHSASASLADIVVVDGDGRPVAAALWRDGSTPPAAAGICELPWFPLPAAAPGVRDDIAAISEIDMDGRVRRVQLRPGNATPGLAVLVDASAVERPVQALQLRWHDDQPDFEQAFDVYGSDDLQRWEPVQADARLLALQQGGARLDERRIVFDRSARWRYLRLVPRAPVAATLRIAGVSAELVAPAAARPWQWQALTPSGTDGAAGIYTYVLDARLPVERIDIVPAGASAARWSVDVRDDDEAEWRTLASDRLAFRVGEGAAGGHSPAIALDRALRMRHWRLRTAPPGPARAPELRVGYVPETLVFVAEGDAPYELRAGSVRARRADAPVAELVASLRRERTPTWQPALATTGERRVLAGDAALEPARDWTTWTLWGVLLLGVGLVGGLAIRLLRTPAGGT
ncbi:DUF3999 family protein [Luteimonas deserti]|uniref:DUF3999 domain-containing protein n=1 Tax=Luteimonas deserti TaxID=2752306 RepID=A0A7Z0QRH3_9GAMM|nr:DUF3999 family protein [Luteimonas deserti]NYZ62430.1 DUF3999 domain-containing protein [Luteimonas deserti]